MEYLPRPKVERKVEPIDWNDEKTLNYYGLQSDVQMFGYLCKCGHYRHDHDVGVFTIITLGKSMGKCETCLCPKYQANRKLDRNNKPKLTEVPSK